VWVDLLVPIKFGHICEGNLKIVIYCFAHIITLKKLYKQLTKIDR